MTDTPATSRYDQLPEPIRLDQTTVDIPAAAPPDPSGGGSPETDVRLNGA